MNQEIPLTHRNALAWIGRVAVCLVLIGAGVYAYMLIGVERQRTQSLEQSAQTYKEALQKSKDENRQLSEALYSEQKRNSEFAQQIQDLASTVGKLDKLSQTDEELLQKYSKVYFLNENYVPERLIQIASQFVYGNRDLYFQAGAIPFLNELMQAADRAEPKLNLYVDSAYRSFDTQSGLKATYKTIYGSGANAFSADQGYSEHQLGTTVDFTSDEIGAGLDGFEKTPEYEWLVRNAWRFGFILSYPQGNTYYVFEPWHWRFVGITLAGYLHDNGMNFYDMDQRSIDQYLVSIFDK